MDEQGVQWTTGADAPVDLDVQVVRAAGRGRLVLGALAAVAVVAGGLVVLAGSRDDADAGRALAAAQEVVEGAGSYRFEILEVSRNSTGDPEGPGTDTTTRILTTGEVEAPERWHTLVDMGDDEFSGGGRIETTRHGDTIYSSMAGFGGPPVGPQWVASPVVPTPEPEDLAAAYGLGEEIEDMGDGFEDAYQDQALLQLALTAYLYDLDGQPASLQHLVIDATDPVVEERSDGGILLRTRLAPHPALADLGSEEIPSIDLMLQLDSADRPVQARFTAVAGSSSSDIEVRFSDWGQELTVAPPVDTDVDHTPWISDEAFAALDPALQIAPSALPAELALNGVQVSDDLFEEGCPSVDLWYGSDSQPASGEIEDLSDEEMEDLEELMAEAPYLSLMVASEECASQPGSESFDDTFGGRPARGPADYREVLVGEAVVTISQFGLDDDALAAMVASIVPATAAELAASIPAWVGDLSLGYGYYGYGAGALSGGMFVSL